MVAAKKTTDATEKKAAQHAKAPAHDHAHAAAHSKADEKTAVAKQTDEVSKKPKKEKKAKPQKPVANRTGTKKTGKDQKKLTKLQQKIKAKAKHNFRRRIGNKGTHNVTDKKWDKWRKARGIDIQRKQNYGIIPDSGYRTPRAIRGLHPSGLKEVQVHNVAQAQLATTDTVVRIAAVVGMKKRKEILKVCQSKKIRVVN